MEEVVFELDPLGLGVAGDGRGPTHIQRAQMVRLRSQEIWTWKSKQLSLAGAWSA